MEVVKSYLKKYVFQKKQNVKAFDMITDKEEAKEMTEHISCHCKCQFDSTTCNSKQKWNNKTCQYECKNYHKYEKDYSWNPSTCICEKRKHLKSVADISVTRCDEIVIATDNLSTKKTNTIATDVTNAASINCHHKKSKTLLHFACSFISDHSTIDHYYYLLSSCKAKSYNIKWEIIDLKKIVLKIVCVIISIASLN